MKKKYCTQAITQVTSHLPAMNNWFDIQSITIQFLQTAKTNNNKTEMIAANILHRL
jgi:hypothetical protein